MPSHRPILAALAAVAYCGACAAAAAVDAPSAWRANAPYRFALTETRSPTPATDNQPLAIHARVDWELLPQPGGETWLRWTTSDPVVTPDAAPVKRNIPQLRDSILFAPDLHVDLRLDPDGRYLGVANAAQVGAALRAGFIGDGVPDPRQEPFFAKITSQEAIDQGVMRVQALIVQALAETWPAQGSRAAPFALPGVDGPAGTLTLTTATDGGLVHRRWETRLSQAATGAALAHGPVPLPDTVPAPSSEMINAVDLTTEAASGRLCRIVYTQSLTMDATPVRMEYALDNVVPCAGADAPH